MKFSDLQDKYKGFYAPSFVLEAKGKDILKESVEVFNVTVNCTLEGASDFSFTISNPFTPDRKDFVHLKKGSLFEVNNEVEIKMGYGDRKNVATILVGLITSVEVSFPANGISQLTVKGYDRSHKMMKGQHSKPWGSDNKPVKYSDIAKELAGKYGLGTSKIEDSKEQHRHLKQDRVSDYAFIKEKLAKEIGFETFVRGADFYFRAPKDDSKNPLTTLHWGRTLLSFSPEINTAEQVSEVEVRGWDSSQQKPIIGKAQKGQERGRDGGRKSGGDLIEGAQGKITKHIWKPVTSKKQAEDLAKAVLDKLSEGLLKGSGECIGIPDILPGENIALDGLGEKFKKTYYIERASHSISASGYKTTFNVKETTI